MVIAKTGAGHQVEVPDACGMICSSRTRGETELDVARIWAAGGSLAALARAAVGGYAIGAWPSDLRAAARVPTGEQSALDPERRATPEEIGP
ncbi:hypothetical protein [Kitasatospora putterlickiae]|uniref:hypothetical protein n=1 Tax=Kitasatospora putterlickiae TaxID=221725 RepID=UPI0031E3747C